MMDLSIVEIEKACGGTLVLNGADATQKVSSVVLDSRQVTPGGVFVATVGERVDGNRFALDVYTKGVILIITEKTRNWWRRSRGFRLLSGEVICW